MQTKRLKVTAMCPNCESTETILWGGMGEEAYFRCEVCGWEFCVAILNGHFVYRVRAEL